MEADDESLVVGLTDPGLSGDMRGDSLLLVQMHSVVVMGRSIVV
jgi:hypothetical protein